MNKLNYEYNDFLIDIDFIIKEIKKRKWNIKLIYAIPRGGAVMGVFISNILDIPVVFSLDSMLEYKKKISAVTQNNEVLEENILIVDDISDTGGTFFKIPSVGRYKTVTIFERINTSFHPDIKCKICNDEWIVFFWETNNGKTERNKTKI